MDEETKAQRLALEFYRNLAAVQGGIIANMLPMYAESALNMQKFIVETLKLLDIVQAEAEKKGVDLGKDFLNSVADAQAAASQYGHPMTQEEISEACSRLVQNYQLKEGAV